MNPILALARKDLKLLVRDKFALFWILAFPLMYALFFGAIFGDGGDGGRAKMKLALVDEDGSDVSAALAANLADSEALTLVHPDPEAEETAPAESFELEAAREAVQKGRLTAYLRIPEGYGENPYALFSGGAGGDEQPKLEIGIDPSRRAEAGFLQGMLMESVFGALQDRFLDTDVLRGDLSEARAELASAEGMDGSQKLLLQTFLGALDTFVGEFDMESLVEGGEGLGAMADPFEVVDVSRDREKGPRSSFDITFPQAIVWGLMSVAMGFAITLVRERVSGTLLRLRMAPIGRAQLLGGKALACFVGCLATMAAILLFGSVALGVRIDDPGLLVLPVEDSISDIFDTLKHVALIQKAGGGTGFSFSRLRPDGDIVASSGGRTSGPMSFIDAFSAGTDAIQQGAFRRGANMGVMRCDHPDVVEFACAKDDLSRWTNYNVSIAVTNDWMQQVVDAPNDPMVVVNPHGGRKAWLKKTTGRRRSVADYDAYAAGAQDDGAEYWTYGEVMDMAIHYAWKNGEPGMLFLDRANEDNQVPHLGEYEATNPCGEQWLLPYGSCNLGSINLGKFWKADAPEAADWEERFDWDAFDKVVHDTTRFLDNVVTINNYPIEQIRKRADEERRIGLGVMGFADLLYKLGVRYGSERSFEIGRKLSARMTSQSLKASEQLCSETGRAPFEAWEGSKPQVEGKAPRRNSHVTTVAPTGTISIISDCSGGIEPLFSLAFQRQVMKDADGVPVVMREVNHDFRAALEKRGYSEAEIDKVVDVALEEGTVAHSDLPSEMKEVFITAHDVVPREHILMQAAWQSSHRQRGVEDHQPAARVRRG